mmetsp:Transcript_23223/g.37834  ORF Transcript_23223/g.37834 Transcript_23223/m.37834 type:complete len:120 (-) Transcript_23223:1129-1488(-)
MTMTNENEKDPRRLTVVLNDPNAEWRDIRSAMSMRAKTSVLGCSTNLAIINSSCSGGVGPDGKRSNLILAAADYVEAAERGAGRHQQRAATDVRLADRAAAHQENAVHSDPAEVQPLIL